MSTVPPAIRVLTRQLLAFEAGHGGPPDTPGDEAIRIFEKLRTTLAKLMGVVGFQALLSRALALAKAEVPSLGEVRVREDGSIKGFTAVEQNAAVNGGEVFVGHFLALLVAFIGRPLTMRLLHDTWPEVSMDTKEEGEII